MKTLTVEAATTNLEQVISFISGELEEAGCAPKCLMQISIAVEELFVNIASYAYKNGRGDATIRMEITQAPPTAVITFIDSGVPYNPLEKKDPDVTLAAEDRAIGGLGIYMVKKSMDDMSYAHENGQNILTIRKQLTLLK